jgi:nucleolar MIF4G domain-containing protein 1
MLDLRHSIMPRSNGPHNGLKLPVQLQHELGIDSRISKLKKRGHGAPQGRKHRRKAEREEKKFARVRRGRVLTQPRDQGASDDYEDGGGSSEDDEGPGSPQRKSKHNSILRERPEPMANPELKSILKTTMQPRLPLPPPPLEKFKLSRSPSPGLVFDRSSKAFKDRAAQDDAEISALEKKLGLKTKKLPKSFDDDGLADLLEGLDSDTEGKKRKRNEAEWLRRKRRSAEGDETEDESDKVEDLSEMDDMDGSLSDQGQNDIDDPVEDVDGPGPESFSFEDFGSEDEARIVTTPPKQRENPYVAPLSANSSTAKYIPPSRRIHPDADTEALQRLRRQIQGHLNKLSEANLVTILAEIEKLYRSQARQDVTSTLTDLLLALFCDRSALESTFVILHAAFIAAAYKVIGTDFGAEMVSKLVERLDELYKAFDSSSGKEAVNLISLLSHLHTFHVIGSRLVFDYIRVLLEEMTEAHTELLLRVVRDVGPQLRQDDPLSLKDMIRIMQNSAAKLEASGQEMSVRTKFMIETITDLKNNKIKTAASVNGVAIEHIIRIRKALGVLKNRSVRASEPLRIGRQDVKDAERKGKWWLVGASWKGNGDDNGTVPDDYGEQLLSRDPGLIDPQDADLLTLAREYRMNTSVRRSIFIAIMSASDFQDAHLRLLKLRLKRSQESEIPKVLTRCAGAETAYNPYYTLIAKKLCMDKRMKVAFQFSFWDFFKRMGERNNWEESDDDDDNDMQGAKLTEIVNLAKMCAGLIAEGALSLTLLKTLNLAYLNDQANTFVELLLVRLILQSQETVSKSHDEKTLQVIFGRTADAPQMISGLHIFIKKVVAPSDLASSLKERASLKWGSKVATDTLQKLRLKDSVSPAA